MATEVDTPPTDEEDGDIPSFTTPRISIDSLQLELKELSDTAQQLLTEKLFLENECAQLKKRTNRFDDELRNLRSPPSLLVTYRTELVIMRWSEILMVPYS